MVKKEDSVVALLLTGGYCIDFCLKPFFMLPLPAGLHHEEATRSHALYIWFRLGQYAAAYKLDERANL